MSLTEQQVLKIILQSNFNLITTHILENIQGNNLQEKVQHLNEQLNKIYYQVIIVKHSGKNYLLLQDKIDSEVILSREYLTEPLITADQTLATEPLNTVAQSTETNQQVTNVSGMQQNYSQLNANHENVTGNEHLAQRRQHPLLPHYLTIRSFLLYYDHEVLKDNLLEVLIKYCKAFDAEDDDELKSKWKNVLQEFVTRGMLSQRIFNGNEYVSDAGGEKFVKLQDLVQFLNSHGTRFDLAEQQQKYQNVQEIYK